VISHDGRAASLYVRRREKGRFLRPLPPDGGFAITPAQARALWSAPRAHDAPHWPVPHRTKHGRRKAPAAPPIWTPSIKR